LEVSQPAAGRSRIGLLWELEAELDDEALLAALEELTSLVRGAVTGAAHIGARFLKPRLAATCAACVVPQRTEIAGCIRRLTAVRNACIEGLCVVRRSLRHI